MKVTKNFPLKVKNTKTNYKKTTNLKTIKTNLCLAWQ